MTTQAPATFGVDIACSAETEDADDLFSEVTGVALVRQDLRHRLLTDTVLGPGGEAWGFDLRKLLGATAGSASAYQPRLRKVVLQDQRIASATVVVTESGSGHLRTLTVTVAGFTALGPFRLVFLLDPAKPASDIVTLIENQ